MKVKEVADLVGISVRTLHHYDEIGLLKPSEFTESGYRLYSSGDLDLLQQILFFKELGFPLKKIKEIIDSPVFNRQEALLAQRRMLLAKRMQLDEMIQTLDKTIQNIKGEITMSNKEKFKGFHFNENPYEKEARGRWGDAAVNQSNENINAMIKQQKEDLAEICNSIYRKLADLRHLAPDSPEAQAAITEWYDVLNNNFSKYIKWLNPLIPLILWVNSGSLVSEIP